MTDETRAPLPESQPPTGETPTVRAEAVIAAAERVSHLPSELCDFIREQARELAEAKQQRANTFADLLAEEEKVGELQAAASQSASGSNWQHFDAAYAKACESSEPKDWMQAALFAQQVRNAVSTIQPRPEPEPHSYALLKLEGAERPLFFVMEERYGSRAEEDYEDSRRFFYEEHSCPTNWLGNCVAVIEDGDADPHGFLSFVRSVPIKQDAEKDHNGEEDWQSIFPEAFVSATGRREG